MTQKRNIKGLSRFLFLISGGLLILLPIISVVIWLKIDLLIGFMERPYDTTTFTIKTQALGMLFSLLPLSIWMFGLYNLRRLFKNYMAERIFLEENAKYIKRFAWVNIIGGGLSPFISGVFTIILSMNHAVGERFLALDLGTAEVHIILLGLIFVVIANVMADAHSLSKENDQFV
ncbi:MAG: hypothetical protein COB54_04355 [Alphaproteobacteria bacterium]|nr:MAG: hypothetical protein COB54_04355 [Alphaproteobacteria bacterium]